MTWLRHTLNSLLARVRVLISQLRHRGERYTQAEIDKLFNEDTQCKNCGGWHQIACPRVKSMRFAEGSQTPVEVVFFPDKIALGKRVFDGWPKDQVIWPWQLAALIKPTPATESKQDLQVIEGGKK